MVSIYVMSALFCLFKRVTLCWEIFIYFEQTTKLSTFLFLNQQASIVAFMMRKRNPTVMRDKLWQKKIETLVAYINHNEKLADCRLFCSSSNTFMKFTTTRRLLSIQLDCSTLHLAPLMLCLCRLFHQMGFLHLFSSGFRVLLVFASAWYVFECKQNELLFVDLNITSMHM